MMFCPNVDESEVTSSGKPCVKPLIVEADIHSFNLGNLVNRSMPKAADNSSSAA